MIWDRDILVLQQVRSVFSADFDIVDGQGVRVGTILTTDPLLVRLVLGNRSLEVRDDAGVPCLLVHDKVSFGRDRMDILGPDGARLAEILKRITVMRPHFTITLEDGLQLELRGSILEREFTVETEQGIVASVSRRLPSLSSLLLERDHYILQFVPGLPGRLRAAVLGGVIGSDLSLTKQRNQS